MNVRHDSRVWYKILTGIFLVVLCIGSAVGILTPAGLGWDFANFYDAGRRVAAGQIEDLYDPTTKISGEDPQGVLDFWGTPVSAWLYAPLSLFAPETALIVFKVQNTIAYFGALTVLFVFNRRFFVERGETGHWKFAALFVGASLLYQPFWTVYRVGGQTTPFVFLLLTIALVAHTRHRVYVSAGCVLLAGMIKPAFMPCLVFLLCVSGFQFLVATVVVSCVVGLVSLGVMGWDVHLEFLMKMMTGAGTTYPWYFNSSIYILGEHLRLLAVEQNPTSGLGAIMGGINAAVKFLVVVMFGMIIMKSRSQEWMESGRRHFHFLMAVLFALLIGQTIWEHYLAMLFLPLAYLIASKHRLSRGSQLLIAGMIFLAVGQNLIVTHFLQETFQFESLVSLVLVCLFKSAPLLMMIWFLVRHYRELFLSYRTSDWDRGTSDSERTRPLTESAYPAE